VWKTFSGLAALAKTITTSTPSAQGLRPAVAAITTEEAEMVKKALTKPHVVTDDASKKEAQAQ
jgi:hypothetical protein